MTNFLLSLTKKFFTFQCSKINMLSRVAIYFYFIIKTTFLFLSLSLLTQTKANIKSFDRIA